MPSASSGGRWPAAAASLLTGALGRWLEVWPQEGTPLIIAIDGHGAAGKSTIAAIAAAANRATLLHTDDFFAGPVQPGPPGAAIGSPQQAALALGRYYDWPRLRAQALEPLREQRAVSFRRFDWDRGSGLDGIVCAAPGDLIILEGVFSAAPVLSDLVSRSVLVETPEAERLRRLRDRVPPDEWDDNWLTAERAYFRLVRPSSSFDLVVTGADPVLPGS